MGFFSFIELKWDQLNEQMNTYLRNVYSRSDESFSEASPFGQTINVQKNLFQWNVMYQKNIVKNINIDEADNQKSIRNLVRIGGHNPTRAISATGTIKLQLKPSVNIDEDISSGKIRVSNKTKLKNKTNGLIYTIQIGKDEEIYEVSQTNNIYFNIIQGTYETQKYTGNGEINQSFSVNIPLSAMIDNFEVEVKYNNQSVALKDGIFDMLANEIACFTRTGMNGGLDVTFGNGDFGFIPSASVLISVTYLLTDGTDGIITSPQLNDFQFIDDIKDMNFNTLNMEDLFDIVVDKPIGFASDGETSEFSKAIMPYISRNFVLATPSQYIYNLKRLSLFSKINVYNKLDDQDYTNDNKIFLFLVPKISNFFSGSINYFNLPLDAFYLDDDEKTKTITYLRRMGNITINTVLDIIQPTIVKYILNIYIRKFQGYANDTIKSTVVTSISTYLSELDRDDRILRSDIINILEDVESIDSVNVSFLSKTNEEYHINNPNDTTTIIGLDPVLGDIVVKSEELAIIRGGWSDRNDTYYNETVSDGWGSLNIIFVGTTERNINN